MLLDVAMCRSSHFQSEGVKSLRTGVGVKKVRTGGGVTNLGGTFAGAGGQYPI